MTDHELKTWPPFFAALLDGTKTFEVRRDDRGYALGDTLILAEWDPRYRSRTGRTLRRRVVYITHLDRIGIPGWVAMGIAPCDGDRAVSGAPRSRPTARRDEEGARAVSEPASKAERRAAVEKAYEDARMAALKAYVAAEKAAWQAYVGAAEAARRAYEDATEAAEDGYWAAIEPARKVYEDALRTIEEEP